MRSVKDNKIIYLFSTPVCDYYNSALLVWDHAMDSKEERESLGSGARLSSGRATRVSDEPCFLESQHSSTMVFLVFFFF